MQLIQEEGPEMGFFLHEKKCELFWPNRIEFPCFEPEKKGGPRVRKEGIGLLGAPVWGSKDFTESFVEEIVDKAIRVQEKLVDFEDPSWS